jgi:hypothetical protein
MLFHKLIACLGRESRANGARVRPSPQPQLEQLENRLTPSVISTATKAKVPALPAAVLMKYPKPVDVSTVTNATVRVVPNLVAGTVTESVTATVMNAPHYDPATGTITPLTPGAATPAGTVYFNLNNQQMSATLDSDGQATVTFTLSLLTVLTSQELSVSFPTQTVGGVIHSASLFNAPLYMNFNNLFFGAMLTFGQLTLDQLNAPIVNGTVAGQPLYNTAQGETDSFGPINFLYSDSGVISYVLAFGIDFPGFVADQFNAYGPEFNSSSSQT